MYYKDNTINDCAVRSLVSMTIIQLKFDYKMDRVVGVGVSRSDIKGGSYL